MGKGKTGFPAVFRQASESALAPWARRCDCVRCMAALKTEPVSLRLTEAEKKDLAAAASLTGDTPGSLAGSFVREGVRRERFPAVDFRDGVPGRVAYLAGTRWPVWMIADLVNDLGGDMESASKRVRKPAALLKMALRYAAAYPEEISAAQSLADATPRT